MRVTSAAVVLLVSCSLFASAQSTSKPDLTIAANNGPAAPNYSGWPILLTGTVALTTEDATFVLRAAQVSLAIYDSTGARLDIASTAVAVPAADVTLNNDNDIATLRYAISPEQTAALSGSHTFELTVGDLKAKTTIRLTAPPDPLPADLETAKRLAFSDFHLATGNAQAALDLVNTELAVAPAFLPALTRAARALEQLGRRDDALRLLAVAIEAAQQQNPNATHPPLELLRRYRELTLASTGVNVQ